MEWSKFIITVVVLYVAYYAFNFLYDMLTSNKNVNKDEVIPLTFEDDTEVKSVDDDFEIVKSSILKDEPVKDLERPLTETGVINEEVLTTNDRKEEYFSPTDDEVIVDPKDVVTPTGAIKVLAQNLISGGLSYKELIKQASQGSILKSATMDFGEEA